MWHNTTIFGIVPPSFTRTPSGVSSATWSRMAIAQDYPYRNLNPITPVLSSTGVSSNGRRPTKVWCSPPQAEVHSDDPSAAGTGSRLSEIPLGNRCDSTICGTATWPTSSNRESTEWAAALACAEPSALRERGLWLRLTIRNEGSDVTLLGDGVMSAMMSEEVSKVGGLVPVENLVVFDVNGRPAELVVETGFGSLLDLGKPPQQP